MYEQTYAEPSPRKTPQKRTAKEAETVAANGQTDGAPAKKIKQGMNST